jgi:hypothetical protein
MGPRGCPKTSEKDYHSTLRNIPKQRRSHTCSQTITLQQKLSTLFAVQSSYMLRTTTYKYIEKCCYNPSSWRLAIK